MSAAAAVKPSSKNPANLSEESVKRPRHPEWFPVKPTAGQRHTGLKMMNSLTEELEDFYPREGNIVKWYTCGPTVYDMSHMGHARAYLTFDILRRIMEDYFGYTVLYQMNITDIDDKIIKRARIGKLLADYSASKPTLANAIETTELATAFAKNALAKRAEQLAVPLPADAPGRVRDEREEKVKELELKKTQFEETLAKIKEARATESAEKVVAAAQPFLGDFFDSERGHTIEDHSIFDGHSRRYEQEFFTDMHRLGVRDPDVLSRVTEVVPEVVTFTQRIIDNGFAYVGESSVFFDTEAYIAAGHFYPKLKPTAQGKVATTEDEMAEGEGALGRVQTGEKRSANDFALWKFSKPGEPAWDSPWGRGRPGWHIECSVMASEVLGDNMDIHGGGCDLKFPHHDNEIAQSEAFWGHSQWVNYFLHCGHLHIKGLKMSKSLKNFITIRQALDDLKVTAREMRLLFLANNWTAPMNFSDQSVSEAKEQERVLRSFFGSVDIVLRSGDAHLKGPQGFTPKDKKLSDAVLKCEKDVHEALCRNFDTPEAMKAIMALVAEGNAYLNETATRNSSMLLRRVGRTVTRYLQVFGVVDGTDAIGLTADSGASGDDTRFGPVVDALVSFRDAVRKCAKDKQPPTALLPLCDALRDEVLPPTGVRLEDRPDGPTQWKLDDPRILMAELAEKKASQEAERVKKIANTVETKKKLLDKWKAFAVHPTQFFRADAVEAVKYSAYDENGLPTHLVSGEALDDKKRSKLKKDQDKYESGFQELQTKGGASFIAGLEKEIAELQAQLKPGAASTGAAAAASA